MGKCSLHRVSAGNIKENDTHIQYRPEIYGKMFFTQSVSRKHKGKRYTHTVSSANIWENFLYTEYQPETYMKITHTPVISRKNRVK